MNTKVTMHFTIEELYASKTAKDKGINNKPSVREMVNLVYLVAYVLEPLRKAMGEPIKIGSGFRCQQLNKAVGGVSNSQLTSASTVTSRRAASGLNISASTCPSTSSSGRKTPRRAPVGYTSVLSIPTSERTERK